MWGNTSIFCMAPMIRSRRVRLLREKRRRGSAAREAPRDPPLARALRAGRPLRDRRRLSRVAVVAQRRAAAGRRAGRRRPRPLRDRADLPAAALRPRVRRLRRHVRRALDPVGLERRPHRARSVRSAGRRALPGRSLRRHVLAEVGRLTKVTRRSRDSATLCTSEGSDEDSAARRRLPCPDRAAVRGGVVRRYLCRRLPLMRSEDAPGGRIQPYILGGAPVFITTLTPRTTRLFRNADGDTDITWGYKGGAGLAVYVYKNLMVFGEYRYTHTEPEFRIRDSAAARATFKTELDSHTGLVGLGARW